jgi:pyruvate dehydrogenase E1 component beta subunit/2-oxoisovalerate dehydrogenase E1 component
MTTTSPGSSTILQREQFLALLKEMLRIRHFEEKTAELYAQGKIRGFLHLYIGEEAVAAGAMQALKPEDGIVATYREHGHALARGIPANTIMAETYGKREGCSRGRGGSMHIFDAKTRFYGGNAIVGGGLPLAVGLALADKLLDRPRVTACFFGEGAVAEGEFHECINLAALWKLPVLFLCENNLYAMGTNLQNSESQTDIHLKAESYQIPSEAVDGMDVIAVEESTRRAADAVRRGDGPRFLEFRTYRFCAHSNFDAQMYRDKGELEKWKKRGPVVTFTQRLQEEGLLNDEKLIRIEAEVQREIDEAVAFAEVGTWEPVENLTKYVYTPPTPEEARQHMAPPSPQPSSPAGAKESTTTTYREAIRDAIREAMQRDSRVFLMGEDVGRYGGCYEVSKGLLEVFGPERIRDTPLSESAFVGAGIGTAMSGMRPIVEIMNASFSLLALDQILNNAATFLHMSGGQFNTPVVIRMATGGGRQLAAQHSHSLEGWYAHIPGIKVLAPATLEDARGMLGTALEDPDPVLIFENALLYNMEGELAANAGPVDIDRAAVRRPGRDVSLITYGGSLGKTLNAAEQLIAEGIDTEVIDLRTLRPLDTATINASVSKTHLAVIIDEGWRTGSISAEISARITEANFHELDAPVARVCSAEVPMPYAAHMEQAALPQTETIVQTVRQMVDGNGRVQNAPPGHRHGDRHPCGVVDQPR